MLGKPNFQKIQVKTKFLKSPAHRRVRDQRQRLRQLRRFLKKQPIDLRSRFPCPHWQHQEPQSNNQLKLT